MARIYRKGEVKRPRARFQLNGAAYDPSLVTVTIRPPSGPAVTRTAGVDATVYHDSPGDYVTDVELNQRGTWYVDWLGTGTFLDTEGRTRVYREPVQQVLRVYF